MRSSSSSSSSSCFVCSRRISGVSLHWPARMDGYSVQMDSNHSDDLDDSDSTSKSSDLDDNFFKLKSTMDLKKRKSKLDKKDNTKSFIFEDKKKSKKEVDDIDSLVK